MGVLHGRDLYSHKWINAEIDDAGGERYVVPIKYTIGDYFLTTIKNQLYCFEIDYKSIKTRRGTGVRTIKYLNYDTTHFRPINENVKELEHVLQENGLPRVNGLLSNVFKVLSKREKKEFTSHDLEALIEELDKQKDEYGEAIRNVVAYLKELDVKQIVTPLRGVSNFIEDDLKVTRPAFLGNLISLYQLADTEHKKVTNSPLTAKHDWLKFMVIIMAVALIGFLLYFGYQEGWFDSITSVTDSFGDFNFDISGTPPGDRGGDPFLKKYPTPAAAKAALDRGEISESDIPPEMRELVKNVKTPSVIP